MRIKCNHDNVMIANVKNIRKQEKRRRTKGRNTNIILLNHSNRDSK